MAKVKFYLDNGANIHSCRYEIFDTVRDLRMDEGEWESYTGQEKFQVVKDWVENHIEYGWYEEGDDGFI